jgi:hypothetical protein
MDMSAASNHGFSVLGDRSLVLSHIPMFMAPHQAQTFLEVSMTDSAHRAYCADMDKTGTTDYVFLADPFVLSTLAPDADPRLTRLTGKIYRGWPFNNPNTAPLIAADVSVEVARSLYFQDITKDKPVAQLTYLAFGNGEADYLVHKLVQPADLKSAPKPPGFVQILSGKVALDARDRVVEVSIPGTADTFDHRLAAGRTVAALVAGKTTQVSITHELVYDADHLV